MCRRELTSELHMPLEIPKLLQTHPTDVDDVRAQRDGRLGVVAIRELGAQRVDEPRKVLVERKQPNQLGGCLGVVFGGRRLAVGRLDGFFVASNGLAVQMPDLEEVHRNAPSVATTSPLRVQLPRLLIRFDIDGVVQDVDMDGGAPFFCLLELLEGVGLNPSASAQESEEDGVVVGRGRARLVQALLGEICLEAGKGRPFLGGEMP